MKTLINLFCKFYFTFFLIISFSQFAYTQQSLVNALKSELKTNKALVSYSINAKSSNGNMFISGVVSSEKEKSIIIESAQKISGVISLEEKITVNPAFGKPVFSDAEIKNNINSALIASNVISPKCRVDFTVNDGHVTLNGDYQSFRVIDEISSIILSTEGVRDYSTNITVRGEDYMKEFGGERTVSEAPKMKKKRCGGKKKYSETNPEMKEEGKRKRKRACCGGAK